MNKAWARLEDFQLCRVVECVDLSIVVHERT